MPTVVALAAAAVIGILPTHSLLAVWAILGLTLAAIAYASTGVLHHAETLAKRVPDPFGTLILTISIVAMEVILLSAVLFGPGEHASIARDSTMAALALVIGALIPVSLWLSPRSSQLRRSGLATYLFTLVTLGILAFGAVHLLPSLWVAALTALSYAAFLYRQLVTHPHDFASKEVDAPDTSAHSTGVHVGLLLLTAAPIVLLSHHMAGLLTPALASIGAPGAWAGVIVAATVLLPEGLTTLRAAQRGDLQRVSNLTHGALTSVVGLTIPVVLVIGAATGQAIDLTIGAWHAATLALAAVVTAALWAHPRPAHWLAAAHLTVAAAFLAGL
ncbi:calcium:proton antiporter [Corynebacterium tapiri]|uniref:Calcium:proton antiporter n=1 Tax=Corynebacterium tapiri TaxID=1448266 RepID=A0A5C4U4G3_9CORY|nr:calcium:proton antiporter [Corynebacterium tapiri]TNL97342.1 calcium:proton antiporter [Corynebacterium tapiri]